MPIINVRTTLPIKKCIGALMMVTGGESMENPSRIPANIEHVHRMVYFCIDSTRLYESLSSSREAARDLGTAGNIIRIVLIMSFL